MLVLGDDVLRSGYLISSYSRISTLTPHTSLQTAVLRSSSNFPWSSSKIFIFQRWGFYVLYVCWVFCKRIQYILTDGAGDAALSWNSWDLVSLLWTPSQGLENRGDPPIRARAWCHAEGAIVWFPLWKFLFLERCLQECCFRISVCKVGRLLTSDAFVLKSACLQVRQLSRRSNWFFKLIVSAFICPSLG